MSNAKAYAASSATSPLAATTIARRDPTPNDVRLKFFSVESAIPICTRYGMSGTGSCPPFIHVFRVMRLWAA